MGAVIIAVEKLKSNVKKSGSISNTKTIIKAINTKRLILIIMLLNLMLFTYLPQKPIITNKQQLISKQTIPQKIIARIIEKAFVSCLIKNDIRIKMAFINAKKNIDTLEETYITYADSNMYLTKNEIHAQTPKTNRPICKNLFFIIVIPTFLHGNLFVL